MENFEEINSVEHNTGMSLEEKPKEKCSNCGEELQEEQQFCPKCGTPKKKKNVCDNCGTELQEGQRYCSKCGHKVEAAVNRNVSPGINQFNTSIKKVHTKKSHLMIAATVMVVVLAAIAGTKLAPKIFMNYEDYMVQGNYEKAYEKAKTDEERDIVRAENAAAVQGAFSAENLKNPESFVLRDAYFYKGKAFVMENVSMLRSDVHRFYLDESDAKLIGQYDIPMTLTKLVLLEKQFLFDGALEIVQDSSRISTHLWSEEEYAALNVIYKAAKNSKKLVAALEKHKKVLLGIAELKTSENANDYNVTLRNVDFQGQYANRKVLQIRYQANKSFLYELKRIFSYSIQNSFADKSEYIEVYATNQKQLEIKVYPHVSKSSDLEDEEMVVEDDLLLEDDTDLEKEIFMNEYDEGEEEVMPVKTAIQKIEAYISSQGFSYPDSLIENFFLSLKSKPFVILAGTSGTGKTRLVKLFAEAIGAEYKLVSVRPDWSDGSDLFGHYDLNGNFIPGPVCECFEKAYENPRKPVFLCLDEMNLARVEYYLSDFLSVIESRERLADGRIVTSEIAQYKAGIPANLYVIGTVNMDETTFPFSKKVLDRANTIEFSFVDLMPNFELAGDVPERIHLPNAFLAAEYLVLARDCGAEASFVQQVCMELQRINQILVKANAHVGYRVRDEIVFYMLNNRKAEQLMSDDDAMDYEIMQKILPRIQGSTASIRDMLVELFAVCASDPSRKNGESDAEKMRKVLEDSAVNCRYRRSAEKLEMMVRRFEEDGFTSYWL